MLKVGIVGCGTIGAELARAIQARFRKNARLIYLCDTNLRTARKLKRNLKFPCRIVSLTELVKKSDLIIEAASQKAAFQIIPPAIQFHKKVLVMSVGALLHIPNVLTKIKKGVLYVPSGAIAGIDALLASRLGKIKQVTITTHKPLRSLKDVSYFQKSKWAKRSIRKPVTIFEGNALQATKLFPQNINVAATLSLAGIGPRKTKVRMITSPTYHQNSHEVEFEGSFGRVKTITRNNPSRQNPKTSALAIYSAIACLEKIFSPVKIGT